MNQQKAKRIRRSVKKQSDKIKRMFLKQIEFEPLSIRIKVAFKIIFSGIFKRKNNQSQIK